MEVVAAIQGICVLVSIISLITALLDMGMNGARYAEWTPWGLGMAVSCGTIAYVLG